MSIRQKNVICYHLMSGLEIIGEIVEETTSEVKMKNVLAFNVRKLGDPNDPTKFQLSVQLTPPTMFADVDQAGLKDTVVQKTAIVFNYEPNTEIYEQYCSTTSPIVLPR